MKIPSRMKILGYDYEVELDDFIEPELCGLCDSRNCIIRVTTKQSRRQIESTFVHEIIEAINSHLNLKLEHPQIHGLEVGLYSTLSENNLLKGEED